MINGDYRGQNASVIKHNQSALGDKPAGVTVFSRASREEKKKEKRKKKKEKRKKETPKAPTAETPRLAPLG